MTRRLSLRTNFWRRGIDFPAVISIAPGLLLKTSRPLIVICCARSSGRVAEASSSLSRSAFARHDESAVDGAHDQ